MLLEIKDIIDNDKEEEFYKNNILKVIDIMKNEMFYGKEYTFNSLDELRQAMIDYIYYYNNERYQWSLNKMTPAQRRCHF